MIKKILKEFIPPILLKYLKTKPKYGWFGDYPTWDEAKKESIGYDTDTILLKVKESLLKVKNDDNLYELDTLLYKRYDYPYNWQALTSLLLISQLNDNRLNVVDFGGSLGSSYFQHRRMLSHLTELNYQIVEQNHFVEEGKKSFEDNHLSFHYNLENCIKGIKTNCLLLSGVIQYIEDPYKLIKEILQYEIDYIIIDRTPFFLNMPDRITIQKVSPDYHEAIIPCRIFNYERFKNYFLEKYNVITESISIDGRMRVEDVFAEQRFILFRSNKSMN